MPTSRDKPITLTEARPLLFRLADELLSGSRDRVRFTQRGAVEELVLIRSSTLNALEQRLAMLQEKTALEQRPLRGIGRALAPVEDIIAGLRREQQELAQAKVTRYSSEHIRPARVAEKAPQTARSTPKP